MPSNCFVAMGYSAAYIAGKITDIFEHIPEPYQGLLWASTLASFIAFGILEVYTISKVSNNRNNKLEEICIK